MKGFFQKYGILAVITVITLFFLVGLAITGAVIGWDKYTVFVHQRAGLSLNLHGFLKAPWALLIHPFVSMPIAAIFTLLQLMLLWTFGLMLGRTIGERKTRALLIVSLFFLPIVLWAICAPLPFIDPHDLQYGLDMGIMALVGATITLLPGYKVRVFFVLEVKLVWLGLFLIFASWISGIVTLTHTMFSVPLSAGFGWLYVTQQRKGRDLAEWVYAPFELKKRKKAQRAEVARKATLAKAYKTFQVVEEVKHIDDPEEEINRILDKISAQGYDKLTRAEKEFLDRNAQK
jgi:hypothetical protein